MIPNTTAAANAIPSPNTTTPILALTRLKTNCTLRSPANNSIFGPAVVIIDSGSPYTVVDQTILTSLSIFPTGEYFPGVGGGLTVPPGNSIYQVYLKTDVSKEKLTKVYASVNPFPEARVLLGIDWLQAADPDIDWSLGTITSGDGNVIVTPQDPNPFDWSMLTSGGGMRSRKAVGTRIIFTVMLAVFACL